MGIGFLFSRFGFQPPRRRRGIFILIKTMGTRADFYIRIKKSPEKPEMKWLGSVAWDGYPSGFDDGPGLIALTSTSEKEFAAAVEEMLIERDDATFPSKGWPWPWKDSCTTDYAYVFYEGKVLGFCFGCPFNLQELLKNEEQEDDFWDSEKVDGYFPDMTAHKNVAYGNRSGLISISI